MTSIDINGSDVAKVSKGLEAEGYYVTKNDGSVYYVEKKEFEGSDDSIVRAYVIPKSHKTTISKVSKLKELKSRFAKNKNFKDIGKNLKNTVIPKSERNRSDRTKTPEVSSDAIKKQIDAAFPQSDDDTVVPTSGEAVANKTKDNIKKSKKTIPGKSMTMDNDGFGWVYSPFDGKIISNSPVDGAEYAYFKYNDKTHYNQFRIPNYNSEEFSASKFIIFFAKPDIFNEDDGKPRFKLVNSYDSLTGGKDGKNDPNIIIPSYKNKVKSSNIVIDTLIDDFKYIENEVKKLNITSIDNNLLPLMSNRVGNMPANSMSLESVVAMEGVNDSKITLPDRVTESQFSGTVSLQFKDKADMAIWKLIRYWIMYMDAGRYGLLTPTNGGDVYKKSLKDSLYIPYTSSIYCVLLDDMNFVKYFCRYGAVYPTNIPSDVFDTQAGDRKTGLELNVEFQYNYFEEYNENIITDLNKLFNTSAANKFVSRDNSTYKIPTKFKLEKQIDGRLILNVVDDIKK